MARWEHYLTGLSSTSLDLQVAQRALRDGCSAKEVTLMLVAGSETVRLIYDKQGRKEAIAFAQHIVTVASPHYTSSIVTKHHSHGLEIGD
ncbi:hypothetical protein VB780_11255 [Leptolyngbya sp. CCNP1308]|uniref:hypothetical protein n=1 Tax=Leptolyngbya sp. CCNP1308 TaxID=3110255 RepID=UPI002B2071FE|nr:hypothetical protein [Leptolyngbya sp. CCNP1308]MEA5449148.1 hypothetical protein [Leptolyngbya sp. CCNP1308]